MLNNESLSLDVGVACVVDQRKKPAILHNCNIRAMIRPVSWMLSLCNFVFCEPLCAQVVWFCDFLLVFLSSLAPTILSPCLLQDSWALLNVWLWFFICLHQLLDKASLMTNGICRKSLGIIKLPFFFFTQIWFHSKSLLSSWCFRHCHGWAYSPGKGPG